VNKDEKVKIAQALGAARMIDVAQRAVGGPLDMISLRDEVSRRLRSSGGRPTDPSWNVSRQVRFKEECWLRLQGIADEVGASGRRVGPAQIAAILVESSLADIDDTSWPQTLEQSRRLPPLSERDAADAAAVARAQLDEWVGRGWLVSTRVRGRRRSFDADEVVRAVWLRTISLMSSGNVEALAEGVRACDLSARYLVLVEARCTATAATRPQLLRMLEQPGSNQVIDQLPERRKLLGLPLLSENARDEQRSRWAV